LLSWIVHVAPGRQTCTRGYADGAGRVGRGEAGAACGEAIDVRRSDDRVADARQGARLMFVGNDEVGPFLECRVLVGDVDILDDLFRIALARDSSTRIIGSMMDYRPSGVRTPNQLSRTW
jgi:hypothetical protein